ncbi:MAG: NrfD/PsrC family molybdoenzyme membrane anchor subunit [Dehalococcoidia bacterium]
MQERVPLTDSQVNKDLLVGVERHPLWWFLAVTVLALLVATAGGAVGWMINQGIGVTGLNRPVMWGFFITNFVFWIGISHAGVMISSILRLSQAEWRRPVTRAAEVLTIFSLMTAVLHPLLHSGRPWRIIFWIFPYDFARGIWPNVRSPLVWDPSAINTYLTGATLFVLIALLPDLAVIRDRSTGIRRQIYGVLALGWRGTPRQWRLQAIAGILLSALILPVFVSVHSIVSWDFGMAMAVSSWHSSIFAPYFVLGAVHSGVSAVATMMVLLRWAFKWEKYITPDHFDALGRLLVVVGTTWFFFFLVEVLFGIYSMEGAEIAFRNLLFFQWPWNGLFIVFLLTAYFIPVPMWLFKGVRRNIGLMLLTSILVNIGMWLERLLIIVPGLARKQDFTFVWGTYRPSIVEILIIIGSFALVSLLLLLFSKVFPLIPIFDQKEGKVLEAETKIGRRKVPAIVREE